MTDSTNTTEGLTATQYAWIAVFFFAGAIGVREAYGVDTGLEYGIWLAEPGGPGDVMFLFLVGAVVTGLKALQTYGKQIESEGG